MHNSSPWVKPQKSVVQIMAGFSSHLRRVSQGAVIYGQEDPAEHLYYVVEGKVKVFIVNEDGKERTLAIHEPGTFFGETSFFDDDLYFASAVAMTDSQVLRLDRQTTTDLLAQNPEIFMYMLNSMGRKIRLLTFQVECMSFLTVEKRVIALLFSMFEVYGSITPEGDVLNFQITDNELGNMLGVRREAVTKTMTKLRSLGLIVKLRHKLVIPDREKLLEYMTSDE